MGLDVEDIEKDEKGLKVTLRRSKTDQEGEGRKVGIPFGSRDETCPVRALEDWLEAAGIEEGPVFRPVMRNGEVEPTRLSDRAVARIVQKYIIAVGLDPSDYAGHSLRAGHATTAAANGASERALMNQTGHRSVTMARKYIREGSLFRENSAEKLGL